jgi:hypothetical protein
MGDERKSEEAYRGGGRVEVFDGKINSLAFFSFLAYSKAREERKLSEEVRRLVKGGIWTL